jgi:hypothetical protein
MELFGVVSSPRVGAPRLPSSSLLLRRTLPSLGLMGRIALEREASLEPTVGPSRRRRPSAWEVQTQAVR